MPSSLLRITHHQEKKESNKPADAGTVDRGCFNQILWENDVMRQQLAEIGKSFGEKMDDVRRVVLCKDCSHSPDGFVCLHGQFSGMTFPSNFCSDGERK